MWDSPHLLSLNDGDFDRAPLLWSRADARVLVCSVDAVTATDPAAPETQLLWQPATGPYDPRRCWLLDGRRAWFVQPAISAEGLVPLRGLWPLLEPVETEAAVAGVALTAWHTGHGFCPACGGPIRIADGGWLGHCHGCGSEHYPHIDPAIIVALVDGDDRLLLGSQPSWGKRRSVFAGFVMAGESLEQAVHREVAEETGLTVRDIGYFGSQPWPFPRSLMVAFTARVDNPGALHVDGREIIKADWLTRDEVKAAWADGDIDPPPPASIAYRLIQTWLGDVNPETER